METAVEKVEAMFLKSKADLEYIEKRLKLDFINSGADNGCHTQAENPAVILADLGAIKAKHANLFFEMEEIAAAQRRSMGSVRRSINTIKELTQHLQPAGDVEVSSVEASGQQQPISCGIRQLSDSAFKSVPLSIRSKVKLPELNSFYQQLQEHLCKNNSSLSMQKMKQLKLNMSEAKLKVLQHLTLIEIDKKGSVRLLM
ncbi:spindle and kinetochore-associated protein 2-like [Takifugu rubripes]|uniref:spindle and kinetochore-associated protein 2-like n=2 Tax=Takifugu rubripes TaxID=31033 RepID=UPI0005D1EECB|nr:spindle and kinetochore-associated protein 2-like [Takifugu rubripes]|eukprot:XP_011618065.1 PREDICTED: spindle and kinetochore-associated protein 2-like [Takifugu rubripes]